MKKILLFLSLVLTSINLSAQLPTNGLIGYWPFNGNANDSSGNGHNGVVTNAFLTTDRFGNTNSAYSFGGTSKYITVADALPLRLANTDFSISFWFNESTILAAQEAILSKRGTGSQNGYILNVTGTLAAKPGLVNYQVSGGLDPKVDTDSAITINTWHNYTLVYTLSNQEVKVYVDGIIQADTTGIPSPNASTTADLIIGNDAVVGNYPFNGKLDDIAMYDRVLTFAEVQNIYSPCTTINLLSSIVAQYNFSGNANDISGNNHNGTVSGATLTTDRFGNANSAYDFNGSTSRIDVPDQAGLRLGNTGYSISAWINQSTALSNNTAIISKRNGSGQNGYIMNVIGTGSANPGRLSFNVSGGADPKAISDTSIGVNAWHHVAVVYNHNTRFMLTFIDGVVSSSTAGIPSLNAATTAIMNIGSDGTVNPYFFNGKIDDIVIYNRPLSTCEIDSLFHLLNPVPTGIENVTGNNTFEIFPNPVKEYFTISNLKNGEVKINNAFGQLVKTATITELNSNVDIHDLATGLYFVVIRSDNNKVIVKKIIKD